MSISIVLFNNNYRIKQNSPLFQAIISSEKIIPIYIHPQKNNEEARNIFLNHALEDLNASLFDTLNIFHGNEIEILMEIFSKYSCKKIYAHQLYEPTQHKIQEKMLEIFGNKIEFSTNNYLYEIPKIKNQSGDFYKVFTPFFKYGCLSHTVPPILPQIEINPEQFLKISTTKIANLNLMPSINWHNRFPNSNECTENFALKKLEIFLKNGIFGYKELRNRPDLQHNSQLSTYLSFGKISPQTIWHKLNQITITKQNQLDLEQFRMELCWREFSYNLLWNFPQLETENFNKKFDNFPWEYNKNDFNLWKQGKTGYPIVDAGMRELWQTGIMHNRVRMIVASFLVKHLLIDWRFGEKWFKKCLIDYDIANNSASWQWVAGCGADAAPYFRIFNPILQGKKFDPDGKYIKKYIPELANIPIKFLHEPWLLTPIEKIEFKTENYANPIINCEFGRDRALRAFEILQSSN